MFIISFDFWAIVYMVIILAMGFLILSILVMHFLMPKIIIEKYFKPPFFGSAECILFSGIPYAPMRTVMLMRVLGFPDSGKMRGLTEAYKLAPMWYRNASKTIIFMTFFLLASAILVGAGFGIYFLFSS